MSARKRRSGGARRIRGGRPARRVKGVVRRRTARPAVRRGANIKRTKVRNIRRQKARVKAKAISRRPRPAVRPKAVPSRVMARRRKIRRPKKVIRPPRSPKMTARRIKSPGIGATALAGAAVASTFFRLNAAKAHPDIVYEVNSIQSSLDDLQEQSSFADVRADIANLDANLSHALSLLESARDKGYRYQGDLEDIAFDAMSRWQDIRNDVNANIQEQTNLMRGNLKPVDSIVQRLNSSLSNVTDASSIMGNVQDEISQAMGTVYNAEQAIEGVYADIEAKAALLISRLTGIHWALTQRDESTIEFKSDEDLYMAVTARWDQAGKDDPEGVILLTNQRFLFERKEKIATKKVLFITTASELVQELMISKPLAKVEGVKAKSEGVFGHHDFLEVDLGDKTIPFHITGQDSEDWARMVLDAKSGKIEEQRSTGSGLSFADLTGDVTEADIIGLQNEVNELQDEMMLKGTQEELAELENNVSNLSRELADIRARGYAVEKSLEADLQVLSFQYEKIKQRAHATLEYQTKLLGERMSSVQGSMAELAGMTGSLAAARPKFVHLKSEIASAEAQAEAAEQTVLEQYDEYADEVETLDSHLEWVDWMLDAISTASFQLLATESGVAAVEAEWGHPGLEPENGILYLTDQRFLWEDRTGDFQLKFDVPLSQVEDVKEETDEENSEESLVVTFTSSAPAAKARFSLDQPVAEEWLQMVGRARSGDYAIDRAIEISEAELERIRSVPEQCSNCGAAITAPVLRGQTELTCEFCGVVTRI